jgi:hypothetical protein
MSGTVQTHSRAATMVDSGGTVKCYAHACSLPPTMSLALRRHSGRWTNPEITYCTEHAASVAERFQVRGMDTRLTDLGVSQSGRGQ